jgi:hypothetical protein
MERALSVVNSYGFGRQQATSKQERKEAPANRNRLDQDRNGVIDRLDGTRCGGIQDELG